MLRALPALALAVVASACASAGPPPPDPADAAVTGVTLEDAVAQVQTREEHIQRCMEDAGFDYRIVDPRSQIIADRDQPGWGSAYELLQLARDREGASRRPPSSEPEARRPGNIEARQRCAEQAFEAQAQRMRAVEPMMSDLRDAEEEFRSSSAYTDAAQAWSECMRALGHDVAWPDEVLDEYNERLVNVVEAAGGPGKVDEADALALLEEEIALRADDDECRADTVDAVELEFKRQLFSEEAEAIDAIRRAYRG